MPVNKLFQSQLIRLFDQHKYVLVSKHLVQLANAHVILIALHLSVDAKLFINLINATIR